MAESHLVGCRLVVVFVGGHFLEGANRILFNSVNSLTQEIGDRRSRLRDGCAGKRQNQDCKFHKSSKCGRKDKPEGSGMSNF